MIDISGLDKIDVLRVLYDSAKPQGLGFLHYDPNPMTRAEAAQYLYKEVPADNDFGQYFSGSKYFDYVKGRVMKVDLTSDVAFDEALYDRDNGQGAAARAVNTLRG